MPCAAISLERGRRLRRGPAAHQHRLRGALHERNLPVAGIRVECRHQLSPAVERQLVDPWPCAAQRGRIDAAGDGGLEHRRLGGIRMCGLGRVAAEHAGGEHFGLVRPFIEPAPACRRPDGNDAHLVAVSVPVLSVQITVVLPSVSTAGSWRTTARRPAIRCTPTASAIVTIAGSPSGIAATASAIAASVASRTL